MNDFENLDPEVQAEVCELAKQKEREYHKQWRDRNKEKVRAYRKSHYLKKAMQELRAQEGIHE
ncbi:MAG: hypothetical protein NUV49_02460 [Patescibacteria group bacterium]|nr:hypothetical protein [Patescibacteria group bacterium]